MKATILFSGGKDSCLAAIMLSRFFEVELITYNFGLLDNWKQAKQVAEKLKLPFKIIKLPQKILDEAVEITNKDGFPNNGIKYIHQKALEFASQDSKVIADGMRRDDRVPILLLSEIRHLEDKFDVHYIQPLMGYSRKTINILVKRFFEIKEYKSEDFIGAEYEFELREAIKRKYGVTAVEKIFPKGHSQTIVIRYNEI
ncbi:7-cyano-7-deazaguanine synthase [Candidatus Parcubacteria bacterium]|jgi:predicted subunit of tRNA(5-methylaminomethyl-2-thiouridylate) methyltransferase|nr:7-cyano-7-deazaguanine synthase [Candidatus Parcubacteria bacterium]